MNKINLDFKNNKNDYKWNLVQLIYSIVFWIYFLIVKFDFNLFEPEVNGEFIKINLIKEDMKDFKPKNSSNEILEDDNEENKMKKKFRDEIITKIEKVKIVKKEKLVLKNNKAQMHVENTESNFKNENQDIEDLLIQDIVDLKISNIKEKNKFLEEIDDLKKSDEKAKKKLVEEYEMKKKENEEKNNKLSEENKNLKK